MLVNKAEDIMRYLMYGVGVTTHVVMRSKGKTECGMSGTVRLVVICGPEKS